MSVNDLSSPQAMNKDKCPDCGASVVGGRAGCQALFDEITAQALGDLRYATVHPLAFDAYCMQHADSYGVSAKSYAAHLTRLCCGLEYSGNPTICAAIQKWLNGTVEIEKPVVLSYRGRLTVVDVRAARNVEEHKQRVREWAESVWEAYSSQHDLAHTWIEAALTAKDKKLQQRSKYRICSHHDDNKGNR
jgi:hypothetical protein